jgi:hypothetical protein
MNNPIKYVRDYNNLFCNFGENIKSTNLSFTKTKKKFSKGIRFVNKSFLAHYYITLLLAYNNMLEEKL